MRIGDKVTWYRVSQRGRIRSIRAHFGTLLAIEGEMATVQTEGGKRKSLLLSDLRPRGHNNGLGIFEFV